MVASNPVCLLPLLILVSKLLSFRSNALSPRTIFDIDNHVGGINEIVYIWANQTAGFNYHPQTDVYIHCEGDEPLPCQSSRTGFEGTVIGDDSDDPTDPNNLTPLQQKRSITFHFTDTDCFDVSVETYCTAEHEDPPEECSLNRRFKVIDQNKKCPFNGGSRLFSHGDKNYTRDECYDLCYNTTGCDYFSLNENADDAGQYGKCIGCTADGVAGEDHSGFTFFEMLDNSTYIAAKFLFGGGSTQMYNTAAQCTPKDEGGDDSTGSPTVTPTSVPTQTCFNTNQELYDAVDAYIADNSASSATAITYGWPIGTWCVSYITEMFGLFRDKDTFNEDIGQWDVSNVSAMHEMFWGAKVCMIKIL